MKIASQFFFLLCNSLIYMSFIQSSLNACDKEEEKYSDHKRTFNNILEVNKEEAHLPHNAKRLRTAQSPEDEEWGKIGSAALDEYEQSLQKVKWVGDLTISYTPKRRETVSIPFPQDKAIIIAQRLKKMILDWKIDNDKDLQGLKINSVNLLIPQISFIVKYHSSDEPYLVQGGYLSFSKDLKGQRRTAVFISSRGREILDRLSDAYNYLVREERESPIEFITATDIERRHITKRIRELSNLENFPLRQNDFIRNLINKFIESIEGKPSWEDLGAKRIALHKIRELLRDVSNLHTDLQFRKKSFDLIKAQYANLENSLIESGNESFIGNLREIKAYIKLLDSLYFSCEQKLPFLKKKKYAEKFYNHLSYVQPYFRARHLLLEGAVKDYSNNNKINFHTEFPFLKSMKIEPESIVRALKTGLPKEEERRLKIKAILIDVYSYYDMCEDCEAFWTKSLLWKQTLNQIQQKLLNLGFKFSKDRTGSYKEIRSIFRLSSQYPYPRTSFSSSLQGRLELKNLNHITLTARHPFDGSTYLEIEKYIKQKAIQALQEMPKEFWESFPKLWLWASQGVYT